MSLYKRLQQLLFANYDPTAGSLDIALGPIGDCCRHQIVITVKPDPSAGTVAIKGVQVGSSLAPAKFDSRLDAINMANGSQSFVFYGFFSGLHFDFTGFAGGKKVSAALLSHDAELLISENTP